MASQYLSTSVLLFFVLIAGCSYLSQISEENTSVSTEKSVEQKVSIPQKQETTGSNGFTCSEVDTPENEQGKVVLTSPNGQKETRSDYCPAKDGEAFNVFVAEYFCEGNEVKEKLRKCEGSKVCYRGTCI